MSLPIRTLAINSKTEDFPTPVSPTRRMVYGLSVLLLDVLMIPFLRDSTSLENTVKNDLSGMSLLTLLDSLGVILLIGDNNVFVVRRVIPAQAIGAGVGAGAIKVVVIGRSQFQNDLRFALGWGLFIARRYDQNMVYQQYPCNLLDIRSVVIGRRRSGVEPGQSPAEKRSVIRSTLIALTDIALVMLDKFDSGNIAGVGLGVDLRACRCPFCRFTTGVKSPSGKNPFRFVMVAEPLTHLRFGTNWRWPCARSISHKLYKLSQEGLNNK